MRNARPLKNASNRQRAKRKQQPSASSRRARRLKAKRSAGNKPRANVLPPNRPKLKRSRRSNKLKKLPSEQRRNVNRPRLKRSRSASEQRRNANRLKLPKPLPLPSSSSF